MINITTHWILYLVFDVIIIPMIFLTITLMIGWCIYFLVKCCRLYEEYKTCKRTPVLHLLYSDVQYLSKQRKLYNLKTHITKYLLMIVCSSVEVSSIVYYASFIPIIKLTAQPDHNETNIQNCYYNRIPDKDLIINIYFLFADLMSITLISILSRYLAARYLNHPFKPTLIKYLIWCCVQLILIVFCSTPYTWIFRVLVLTIISIANWIVLLRDTSILSRVLRSNLRDIQLYSDNRVFYNQQLSAFKFYRIFRIVSLVSLLWYVICAIGYSMFRLVKFLLFAGCTIHLNKITIKLFIQSNNPFFIKDIFYYVDVIFLFLYFLTFSLTLYFITFSPIILKCAKRCREKEDQYRYNYDKLQALLRKY